MSGQNYCLSRDCEVTVGHILNASLREKLSED